MFGNCKYDCNYYGDNDDNADANDDANGEDNDDDDGDDDDDDDGDDDSDDQHHHNMTKLSLCLPLDLSEQLSMFHLLLITQPISSVKQI